MIWFRRMGSSSRNSALFLLIFHFFIKLFYGGLRIWFLISGFKHLYDFIRMLVWVITPQGSGKWVVYGGGCPSLLPQSPGGGCPQSLSVCDTRWPAHCQHLLLPVGWKCGPLMASPASWTLDADNGLCAAALIAYGKGNVLYPMCYFQYFGTSY